MPGISATEPRSRAFARKASLVCGPPERLAQVTGKVSSEPRPDSSSAFWLVGSPIVKVVPAGTSAGSAQSGAGRAAGVAAPPPAGAAQPEGRAPTAAGAVGAPRRAAQGGRGG